MKKWEFRLTWLCITAVAIGIWYVIIKTLLTWTQ
jgi:hypothetical protein